MIEQLLAELSSSDEEIVRTTIFKLGVSEIGDRRIKNSLFQLLDSPTNFIRDAAAIALGEAGQQEIVPKIFELIHKAKAENIGSLIHALKDLDMTDFFTDIVKLLIEGKSFEVVEMAIERIEENAQNISLETKLISVDLLKSALEAFENQKADDSGKLKYINHALEVLTN